MKTGYENRTRSHREKKTEVNENYKRNWTQIHKELICGNVITNNEPNSIKV